MPDGYPASHRGSIGSTPWQLKTWAWAFAPHDTMTAAWAAAWEGYPCRVGVGRMRPPGRIYIGPAGGSRIA